MSQPQPPQPPSAQDEVTEPAEDRPVLEGLTDDDLAKEHRAITRRKLMAGAAGIAGVNVAALGIKRLADIRRQPEARVARYRVPTYDEAALVDVLTRGIASFNAVRAQVRDATVLLKPNLVEVLPDRPVNTDARLLGAAVEAFRKHGAREVIVGEGPGHHRDTELITELSGVTEVLSRVGARFVDLNLDRTTPVRLPSNFSKLGTLELPETLMRADLVVSVAKLKTHHWAGATLTMKNLFGTVPGAIYGWPKNPLHWAGIVPSILDLWQAIRPGFGIIDGVIAMEGDGPIMGTPVPAEIVFMGPSLTALDAEACRFMGFDTDKVNFLAAAARLGGTVHPRRIEVEGDTFEDLDFAVVEHMRELKLRPGSAGSRGTARG